MAASEGENQPHEEKQQEKKNMERHGTAESGLSPPACSDARQRITYQQ